MRLVASLATRGRPQQLLATLSQHMKCLSRPDTVMILQVDADDFATLGALTDAQLDPRVKVNIQKRPDTITEKWNYALSEPADVYLKAADDDPYTVENTDEKVLQAASIFPDGIGMVWGHMANASFPGVIAYTAKWCEIFGWMEPNFFPYWFSDHWTTDLAKMIGRISFADVRNSPSRQVTQGLREPGWWATWFDAAYLMRRRQAQQVIMAEGFQTPDWMKRALLAYPPVVEFYSRWVNDSVRGQDRQLSVLSGNLPPDARYDRIKAQAIAAIPHLLNDYGMDAAEAARFREALDPPKVIQAIPQVLVARG